MKLQGETEAKEAMIDYVELINLCNGYKELSVESILEKLRVFVIETGMDFLKSRCPTVRSAQFFRRIHKQLPE